MSRTSIGGVPKVIRLDGPPSPELPEWGRRVQFSSFFAQATDPDFQEMRLQLPYHLFFFARMPGARERAVNSDRLTLGRVEPFALNFYPAGTDVSVRPIERAMHHVIAINAAAFGWMNGSVTDGRTLDLQPLVNRAAPRLVGTAEYFMSLLADGPTLDTVLLESVATALLGLGVEELLSDGGHRPPGLVDRELAVRRVVEFIEDQLSEPLSLARLAALVGLSPYQFAREFRRQTGRAPIQYLRERRVDRACLLLRTTTMSISAIAAACGFGSQSHMTTVFRRLLRTTPGDYRRAVGQTLRSE